MKNAMMVAAATFLLAGCSSFQGQPYSVFTNASVVDPVRKDYSPSRVIEDYYKIKGEGEEDAKGISKIAKQRAYRDKVVALYMVAIDSQYDQFQRNISMQNKGGNSAVDIASLALSTSVPLFNGTGTKDALGAGSSFLSGSQGKVNSRVFYEATLPAIISVMESRRIEIQADILRKKKKDAASKTIIYDIGEAMIDLERYENAVSIDKAISVLNQKASADLTTAQDNLDESSAAPKPATVNGQTVEAPGDDGSDDPADPSEPGEAAGAGADEAPAGAVGSADAGSDADESAGDDADTR